MKLSILPQPAGLLKLIQTVFHMISIQERELCLNDFEKYTFNIC